MTADLDLATVLKELKDFYPLIEPRILLAHRRKMDRIFKDFDQAVGAYLQKFERTDIKSCLAAVQQVKQFLPHHLDSEVIAFFKRIFTVGEIASLFGCTEDNINNRYRAQVKREEKADEERSNALGIPNLPESMRGKAAEDITDEEAAQIAKIVLIRRVLENNDLDAASKLVNMFNQTVKTESLRKWQQVKLLDEFYMSKLLPALQKEFSNAGINLDVKIIVKKILSDLSDEMRGKVKEAVESSELDDLVMKAKRRGKFVKGQRLFPDKRKMSTRLAAISQRKVDPETTEEKNDHDRLIQSEEEDEDLGREPRSEEGQEQKEDRKENEP